MAAWTDTLIKPVTVVHGERTFPGDPDVWRGATPSVILGGPSPYCFRLEAEKNALLRVAAFSSLRDG